MTYFALGLDPEAGQMGVAVQSHWLGAGAIVPWAAAGVGVLATQANCSPDTGERGLELLRAGQPAQKALARLLANDARRAESQIALLTAVGEVAVHTGRRCVGAAGHISGPGWSVQANMMLRPTVPAAMAAAWAGSAGLPLAGRLLAVLRAAQEDGGDIRGLQSAAMLIVSTRPGGGPVRKLLDIRVDDSTDPLAELARLSQLGEAYRDHELGLSQFPASPGLALEHWTRALTLAPDSEELGFWQAAGLAAAGHRDDAAHILRQLAALNEGWRTLLHRLPDAGLLAADCQDGLLR